MKKILNLFRNKGFVCYTTDRYNLDNVHFEPYQDEGEEFDKNKIFETDNKSGKFIKINNMNTSTSLFKFFLDGSRYTYKIAEMETADGKFMPIIAGQLATGVCSREEGKIKKYDLKRKNALMVYHQINSEDFIDLKEEIKKIKVNKIEFILEKYQFKNNTETRPENLAIAKIQKLMMGMEIDLLTEMVIVCR
ncbi:hypothetical protein HNQ80_001196 [Anaerosolibacter carboniphilus]|uniref:Uncharacterized protein n=1 Tax=Anaerosolibacter carboniphilus TaxID=1417629 RepID=A0A841KNU9_9FIRM|nr:hypothetical protein [Anaerosolibacter carboniphilus]MBB6215107.1 hypothetical protein [Anaerosolibacter carboniphilus]